MTVTAVGKGTTAPIKIPTNLGFLDILGGTKAIHCAGIVITKPLRWGQCSLLKKCSVELQ